MKYTKGKWSVTGSGNSNFKLCIIAEDGGSICHITNWQEAKANAKLISKAPEMYEALKLVYKDLTYKVKYQDGLTLQESEYNAIIGSLLKELE